MSARTSPPAPTGSAEPPRRDDTLTDIGAFTDATVTYNPVFTADRSVSGLRFDSGTAAWTFTGSGGTRTLTLGGDGIGNGSTSTQTFDSTLQLTLGSTSGWQAAEGALTINSAVNLNGNELMLSAETASTISGIISGDGGLRIFGGPEAWTLNGDNTFTGYTELQAGGGADLGPPQRLGPKHIF